MKEQKHKLDEYSQDKYQAGQLIIQDYRPQEALKDLGLRRAPALKCVQWNIERGYELDQVIEILRYHDADIICLQELDINCERSNWRDCFTEITQTLEMKGAMLVEFEEFHSPRRNPRTQGGGVHGNAILSRFDFNAQVIPHRHHPINWNSQGKDFNEPRRGERGILQAEIIIPGLSIPISVFSLHFEVFCGIIGRLKQLSDVTEIIHSSLPDRPYQLVFGDLNTMAHGIARLSRLYCRDEMRFGSLGYSEAAWWETHILRHTTKMGGLLKSFVSRCLSNQEATNLINPDLFDPFCVHRDTSLQEYHGLFKGKLDWTLLRGFRVLAKGMDNNDYSASDHKLLYVMVRPLICASKDDDPGKAAYEEFRRRHPFRRPTHNGWITILMMLMVAIFVLPLIRILLK